MSSGSWQELLNQKKAALCEIIIKAYSAEAVGEFWLLVEQAKLENAREKFSGTSFFLQLNSLFTSCVYHEQAPAVKRLLEIIRDKVTAPDLQKHVTEVILAIDATAGPAAAGTGVPPSYVDIYPIQLKIAPGNGPDRAYEEKIHLAGIVAGDANNRLGEETDEPGQQGKCLRKEEASCGLPGCSIQLISQMGFWEGRVMRTVRTVRALEAIGRCAREIDTAPSDKAAKEAGEKIRGLVISINRFLDENGFPIELSGDLATEAKNAFEDLLGRAELKGSHTVLEELFTAFDFIKRFVKSGCYGRQTACQQEFESQYFSLLANSVALRESINNYIDKVLSDEHEGFTKAVLGAPEVAAWLRRNIKGRTGRALGVQIPVQKFKPNTPPPQQVDMTGPA